MAKKKVEKKKAKKAKNKVTKKKAKAKKKAAKKKASKKKPVKKKAKSKFNLATWRKHAGDSIKLLIEAGAKVNVKSKLGSSPLHNAAEIGAAEVVRALIEVPGIKLNRKVNKQTAYEVAEENRQHDICSILEEAGATPS